jgi:hypothetical protein
VHQHRRKKGKLTSAIITIFALGCADVFLAVGMLGGFKILTLVGVGILALFVFGYVCSAAYILVSRRTTHPKPNRLPRRGGEWLTR